MKNRVVVKDRDEWDSLAGFIGNMIAKYSELIDFDSLSDPDMYIILRDMPVLYRTFIKEKRKLTSCVIAIEVKR